MMKRYCISTLSRMILGLGLVSFCFNLGAVDTPAKSPTPVKSPAPTPTPTPTLTPVLMPGSPPPPSTPAGPIEHAPVQGTQRPQPQPPPRATPSLTAPTSKQQGSMRAPDSAKVEQMPVGGKQRPEEGYIINFNNVSIVEYIRFISKISGKNFIFDENDLQFNVTIVSDEPTSIDNIMMALLQTLRIHGLNMLEQSNNLLIHKNPQVPFLPDVTSPGSTTKEGGKIEIVTQLFRLKNTSPETVASIVKTMLSPQARLEVVPETRYLVLTDFSSNVSKIANLIKGIDNPSATLEIGQYVPKNGSPTALIDIGSRILKPLAEHQTFLMVPNRTGVGILVVSSPYLVERAMAVLRILDSSGTSTRIFSLDQVDLDELDDQLTREQKQWEQEELGRLAKQRGGKPGAPGPGGYPGELRAGLRPGEEISGLPPTHISQTAFGVMKLQFRKGDQLQKALQALASRLLVTGQVNQDIVSTINSLQWVSDTNMVVFTGTREATQRVRELVSQLDTPVKQVFIEMLILTTSVDNALTFGTEFGVRTFSKTFADGIILDQPNSLTPSVFNSLNTNGFPSVNQMLSNTGFGYGIIGQVITHGGTGFNAIGALINALNLDTDVELIMNPKLIAEDGNTAEVFIGQNRPFQGQSIANEQGSILTTNFEFRDIGTRLRVTPYIGRGDIITLEIDQETTSVVDPTLPLPNPFTSQAISSATISAVSTTNTAPVVNKTTTTTRVHVPNSYFVILSGLLSDKYDYTMQRVPCLGGLPLIGGLFGTTTKKIIKSNLMIFIRPQLCDTPVEIEELTKRNQDMWRDHNTRPDMFNYELDTTLEILNLKKPVERE